jgi:hypothetical protein
MRRPPFTPRNIPGNNFCYRLSRTQSHSAAGWILSIEKLIDVIGNRTRDLPVCSIVSQPTTPPRAPALKSYPTKFNIKKICIYVLSSSQTLNNNSSNDIVACRSVTTWWLCKQRPLLGNGRNRFLTFTNGLTGKRFSLRGPCDSYVT